MDVTCKVGSCFYNDDGACNCGDLEVYFYEDGTGLCNSQKDKEEKIEMEEL